MMARIDYVGAVRSLTAKVSLSMADSAPLRFNAAAVAELGLVAGDLFGLVFDDEKNVIELQRTEEPGRGIVAARQQSKASEALTVSLGGFFRQLGLEVFKTCYPEVKARKNGELLVVSLPEEVADLGTVAEA